ncbi:4357_t:CDS:2, partial [Racocetra fulgida]
MSESSSSQVPTQSFETKKCSYCKKIKSKADFHHLRSDDPLYKHGTYNMCFEEHSKRRHEKKAKTDTYLNLTVPTIGISISNVTNTYQVDDSLEVYDDHEPTSEANPEFANAIQIEEIEKNITTTQDDEYNDLDLEDGSLDLKKVKESFAQLTKILILPLESGSGYYWNIHKLCLNLKRKAFTGCATAYLYCASCDDQIWQRQDNQEVKRGFKILTHFDNNFVHALGFITPLFSRIGVENITEIVIDSTFKTNQKQFELFVVNANCRGYSMPLAYLYLLVLHNPEVIYHYLEDGITTRIQVLKHFFFGLRQEGLLPSFVLLDKDAGEILAVGEAWFWKTNIQLCYWHLENAISK